MAEKNPKGEKEKEKKGFLKPGKIVIIVSGRFAGKKAIVVKTFDEGTPERKFGHALVAGIERGPLAVSKSMSKKKILKRSKVKPFLKYINFNHMMPTRYTANDIDLRTHVTQANVKKADTKKTATFETKKLFEGRYLNRGKNSPGVQYFFHKLRF